MKAVLTQETLEALLLSLDADREQAGEKYEGLRRVLVRFFEWRGAPSPEDHADEVLNRVARKLSEGIPIMNMTAYCYEVARLVFLETMKATHSKTESLESTPHDPIADVPDFSDGLQSELRLDCLEECLRALPPESAELIKEYYCFEEGGQIERRKALAQRLGLRRMALANRMHRLRDKLQSCVSTCFRKKTRDIKWADRPLLSR